MTTSTTTTMESLCKKEVIRIHEFFVDWLKGTIPKSMERFQQDCGSVLGAELHYVKPNGTVVQQQALFQQLYQAHGTKQGQFFDMEIHDIQIVVPTSNSKDENDSDVCVVLYQEWHYGHDLTTTSEDNDNAASLLNDKRQCTALFRRCSSNTPHGVEWIHIHETSMLL